MGSLPGLIEGQPIRIELKEEHVEREF
jgi:hypothetical protein